MKMSNLEESLPTRASAGTDGQEPSPTPVDNMQGLSEGNKENTRRNNWAETLDEEAAIEGEMSGKQTSPTLHDSKLKEGDNSLNTEKNKETTIPIKKKDEEFLAIAGNSQNYNKERENREKEREKREKERQRREQKRIEREIKMREQRKRLEEFENIFRDQEKWCRYLSLKADKELTAMELDDFLLSIHASEEMTFKSKLNDRTEWIIRTTSEEQSKKYLQIKEIKGNKVTVTTHSEMNSIWGTMLMFNDDEEDEDRCLRILEKRHRLIQEVKFIKLSRANIKIAKIKFKGKNLPEKIFLGGRRRDVKAYIPKPSQCHNCSKYGHYRNFCHNQTPVCFYCGSHDHPSQWECGGQERCVNCEGDHHARSTKCPSYIYNSQVKHLQIRTGMSIRDARDELRERGVIDPTKRKAYSAATRERNNQGKTDETLTQTQQFNPANRPSPKKQDANKGWIETSNKFERINEERLDENTDKTEIATEMEGIEGFWDAAEKPKPQRKNKGQTTPSKQNNKGAWNKRSRETSPTTGKDTRKESKQNTSPPTKKSIGIGYSSSSEEIEVDEDGDDDKNKPEEKEKEEEKGMPIPTIMGTGATGAKPRELIPNPFRGEVITQRGEHPLRSRSQSPATERNDLEGIRNEMEKIYGAQEEENTQATEEHPETCGCEKCFWEEKKKVGKLTEKNVNELIENFVKKRDKNTIPWKKKHTPLCMCMICIQEKVKISTERMIKELLKKT